VRQLASDIAQTLADMIFSGMLGASVMYRMGKSLAALGRTINSRVEHLTSLATRQSTNRYGPHAP